MKVYHLESLDFNLFGIWQADQTQQKTLNFAAMATKTKTIAYY